MVPVTSREPEAELGRLYLITYRGPAGTFQQRTELTPAQHDIYNGL